MTPELKKAIIKAIEAEARRKWGEEEERAKIKSNNYTINELCGEEE